MTIVDALLILAGFCLLFAAALAITALLWRTSTGKDILDRLLGVKEKEITP